MSPEHAMIERAAAAQNAGIKGYQPSSEAVRASAASRESPPRTCVKLAVAGLEPENHAENPWQQYAGTSSVLTDPWAQWWYAEREVTANEPIVDVWTFGPGKSKVVVGQAPERRHDSADDNSDESPTTLFQRLKSALPNLNLKSRLSKSKKA